MDKKGVHYVMVLVIKVRVKLDNPVLIRGAQAVPTRCIHESSGLGRKGLVRTGLVLKVGRLYGNTSVKVV